MAFSWERWECRVQAERRRLGWARIVSLPEQWPGQPRPAALQTEWPIEPQVAFSPGGWECWVRGGGRLSDPMQTAHWPGRQQQGRQARPRRWPMVGPWLDGSSGHSPCSERAPCWEQAALHSSETRWRVVRRLELQAWYQRRERQAAPRLRPWAELAGELWLECRERLGSAKRQLQVPTQRSDWLGPGQKVAMPIRDRERCRGEWRVRVHSTTSSTAASRETRQHIRVDPGCAYSNRSFQFTHSHKKRHAGDYADNV